MSLLSRITASASAKASSSLLTKQHSQTFTFPIHQTRQYWREVLRHKPDPKNPGRFKFEDPEQMAQRSGRAQNAEGLLARARKYQRYEKPWMKRKRLKEKKIYNSMNRAVKNLTSYVHYVNDAKKILSGKKGSVKSK